MRKLLSVLSSTLQGGVRGGLLLLALLATSTLWAFQSGDLYYYITSSSAPYTVEVGGAVSSITTATIPETVTYNGITYSVTSIRSEAFWDCSSLTSITIPNSVTSIGDGAFGYCSSLTSITIPNSVTSIGEGAFYGTGIYNDESNWENNVLYIDNCLIDAKTSISGSYTIKENTRLIADYAFYYCSSLTSITIPNSVTSIGGWAFYSTGIYNDESNWENNVLYIDNCLIKAKTSISGSYTIKDNTRLIAEQAFRSCSSLTSVTIPNSVTSIGYAAFYECSSLTSVTIPNSVTSIGSGAFSGCSSLTSITIPNSVTSIGEGAFGYCSSLTSITIPNSVTSIGWSAFVGCSSLTSITIPNSVTSIGSLAFYECSSLTSITIPNSVTSIGLGAFENCSSLTSITIPNSVTNIGEYAFQYCSALASVIIGNSVTSIGESAFYGCSSLTSVTIGNSVTSIGEAAFYRCSSLTSITIPNSVTSIGEYAFYECSSLTSITIPNGVTSIGGWAFSFCSSLTSITIPNSVTSIGDQAFIYCSGLKSMVVESGNTVYDSRENCNAIIETATNTLIAGCQNTIIPNSVTSIGDYAFYGCTSLTSITIPNSVTSIGDGAFDGCSSLASITIPNSLTSIGNSAFNDCRSLTSITIPNSVTSIGDKAFRECSSLTSITIPNSVTSIGNSAFWNCSGLTSITCEATIPPTLGEMAFGWYSQSIPVYVPCGSEDAYKAADGWKEFYNIQPQVEYSIQVSTSNSQMGSAIVNYNNCTGNQISAIANYGYHFMQWSDGVTDNPRSLVLTQDTVLTAEFAPNNYSISTQCNDTERGTTSGDVTTTYLDYVTISATANYGYHFSRWNDYNYDNPRQVQVTKDKTYTAYFDKNTYYITKNYNSNQGYINGSTSGEYLDNITLTAEPNYGYHFVQWSDGNTDNPRSLVLTQDTVLTAEFAPNNYSISTQCNDTERGTTSGDVTTTYLDYVTISATANYGYHFSRWNDYNYDNPRQVQVTEDKTYTAYFDKNTYYITKNYDSNQGYVNGSTSGEYLDNITLTAEPNYGYHFAQWSDGNTDNPRSLVLTQDTVLTAEFAPNNYSISTQCNDTERGTTSGDVTTTYLDYVTISATANYGYHFSRWNDYNYDNPRQVQVTEDKTYTAYFDKNTYYITKNYNSNQGYINGSSSGEYLDNITLTAKPNVGYHFVRWSDGNTDNPRHFILTRDTTFSAEFAQTFSGQCGDNLYWSYDETTKTISITGSGNMYDYTADTQPWLLFKEEIKEVTVSNTATSIGTSAFEGCIRLGKVSIGTAMVNIGTKAFAGCNRLYHIYCYPTYPPFADESSFANYNVYLHVPCDNKEEYDLDIVWGNFKYIQCIGAESENIPTDDVVVTPGFNDVTITWPTEGNADTYTIIIKKGAEVFCTLTFNANGQLLNIAFAPGRNGNHPALYAEQAGNGYRFTVTGLEAGTHYAYNIDVRDAANKTITSHTGDFTTKSNVSTAVDDITTNANIQKIMRNGQLIILRDGKTYNAMGAEIQ